MLRNCVWETRVHAVIPFGIKFVGETLAYTVLKQNSLYKYRIACSSGKVALLGKSPAHPRKKSKIFIYGICILAGNEKKKKSTKSSSRRNRRQLSHSLFTIPCDFWVLLWERLHLDLDRVHGEADGHVD